MEYIIILDPDQKNCSLMETEDGFMARFSTYEEAKEEGEAWMNDYLCKSYKVYEAMSFQRNI